jgi:hypothetical protein
VILNSISHNIIRSVNEEVNPREVDLFKIGKNKWVFTAPNGDFADVTLNDRDVYEIVYTIDRTNEIYTNIANRWEEVIGFIEYCTYGEDTSVDKDFNYLDDLPGFDDEDNISMEETV